MINAKQLAERKNGIFSSDVPRIMAGESVRLALEKLGKIEPEDLSEVPQVQLGNLIEPRILDAYEAAHGGILKRSPDTLRHPRHSWLGAHLDGFNLGEVIEAKSVGSYNRPQWGEPGTDEVPDRVLWQVQEQLAVAQLPIAKVPVCFLTEKALVAFATGRPVPIDVYVVPADADLEAYIVERCGKVWEHIQAGTAPELETPIDARLLYQKDSGKIVEADKATVIAHAELLEALAAEKASGDKADLLKAKIQAFMKEASELRYQGKTLATWKLTKDSAGYTVGPKPGYRKFLTKERA
jgi:YqaJ-like recombinase protein